MTDKTKGYAEISLSELIHINRLRMNMSQTDLAKAAGCSRNYISLIERGHIENVTFGTLSRICLALKINNGNYRLDKPKVLMYHLGIGEPNG